MARKPVGLGGALGVKRQLAVDWDARSLRVVQFRARHDRVEVVKALSVPIPVDIPADNPEAFGAFLRHVLEQARITDRRAAFCVPRDKVVVNTLTVPPTSLDELPAVVHFQSIKELPFAADEATIDFAVRGSFDPKSPADLLVAAARRAVLDLHRGIAREAGLRLEGIGLRPHANLVAFTAAHEQARAGRVIAVDVGPHLTEIDILRDGGLVFSRSASVSLPSLPTVGEPAEIMDSRVIMTAAPAVDEAAEPTREAVAAVVVEVARSFEAYRATDSGGRLDRIVVAGATGIEPALAEALHARLGAHAELFNPQHALALSAHRARELRGFSAAIGLALSHGATGVAHFDFLHPKRAVPAGARRLRRVPTAALAAAMLLMGALVFYQYVIHPRHERISTLTAQVSELEQVVHGVRKSSRRHVAGIRNLEERLAAVDAWTAEERIWTAALLALTRAFPDDRQAYCTRMVLSDQPPAIDLELRTAGSAVSAAMVERLNSARLDAIVGKSAQQTGRDRFEYSDQVRVSLENLRAVGRTTEDAETETPDRGAPSADQSDPRGVQP